jgi:hypothetical protein
MKKTLGIVLLTAIIVAAPHGYFARVHFVAQEKQISDLEGELIDEQIKSFQAEVAFSQDTTKPLFYDLGDLNVTVKRSSVNFTDLFTAKELYSRVENCNQTVVEGYIDELLDSFEGKSGYQYTFTSNTDPDEAYVVTLFPNVPGYKAVEDFRADFPACDAGLTGAGNMNAKWLRFNSPCGAGYGGDLPTLSCSDISQKLSLEFN